MTREAHPIEAAERRQILAPGASPGFSGNTTMSPGRGERFLANFRPSGGSVLNDTLTTAFGRGYDLSPLRGSIRTRLSPRCSFLRLTQSDPNLDSCASRRRGKF